MTKTLRFAQLLVLAIVGVALIYSFRDDIWSASVDLAHHYALVVRLTEFGSVPANGDPSLGEMQFYPSLGHQFAVVLGRIYGSPLVGMQLAVQSSMVVIWAALGWILWSFPRRVARGALAILTVLLLVGGVLHVEMFDREVTGNYFYSQMIAQALALLVIGTCISLERRGVARYALYVFLIVSLLFIESIHLLPAVELLGLLGLIVVIDQYASHDRWDIRSIALRLLLLLLAVAAVTAHPAFRAMKQISENDGFLPLSYVPNQSVLIGLAVVVVLLSTMFIAFWLNFDKHNDGNAHLALKYVGVLGASIAILCLLQVLALRMGMGSEYACRKYVFGLCSVLIVELAILGAWPLARMGPLIKLETLPRFAFAFDVVAIGVVVFVSFVANLPHTRQFSLSKLVRLEHELNALNSASVPHVPGKINYVVGLRGQPPVIDYMFSIAIFKTPRNDINLDMLFGGRMMGVPVSTSSVITAKGSPIYDVESCQRPSSDPSLAVVDGGCLSKALPRQSKCEGWLYLVGGSTLDRALLKGFSQPEVQGTWTDGNDASFTCKMSESGNEHPSLVRIVATGFVPANRSQRVAVSINGSDKRWYQFDRAGRDQIIDLPIAGHPHDIRIDFSLPDAVSPQDVGIAPDKRKLGIYVKRIMFGATTRDFER